ncbi:hypothetical protein DL93DRAFT_603163 [Clavulina sp. PMI_390]|nr:hypothetical protein DL93DRAFT_603163 [Clavulina sp. PMI_390]
MVQANGQNPRPLTTIASHLEVSHLAFVASVTWFIWDWVLTLSCEIDVMWRRRVTLGSFLYLINTLACVASITIRLPLHFGVDVSTSLCPVIFQTVTILQSIQIAVLQCVLALRTYAVYNCSRLVLVPLLVLNAAGFALNMGENVDPLIRIVYRSNPLPIPYNGCILPAYTRAWPPCMLLLGFELAVGILMMAKLGQIMKNGCSLAQVEYIVFRDGLIESFVMSLGTMVLLVNDLIFPTGDSAAFRPMRSFIPLVGTIACKRLLLNLRHITQSELGSMTKRRDDIDHASSAPSQHELRDLADEPVDDLFFSLLDEEARNTPQVKPKTQLGDAVDEHHATQTPYTYSPSYASADLASDSSHPSHTQSLHGLRSKDIISPTISSRAISPAISSEDHERLYSSLLHPPRPFSFQGALRQAHGSRPRISPNAQG